MVTVTGLLMVDCLSADWLSHGDLSLNLEWAQREDPRKIRGIISVTSKKKLEGKRGGHQLLRG